VVIKMDMVVTGISDHLGDVNIRMYEVPGDTRDVTFQCM
jgi:hypothetical protein